MRKPNYTPGQQEFIILHSEEFTVKELSKSMNIPVASIHNLGIKHNLKFKKAEYARGIGRIPKPETQPALAITTIGRPAAIYNQVGSPYGIASSIRHL